MSEDIQKALEQAPTVHMISPVQSLESFRASDESSSKRNKDKKRKSKEKNDGATVNSQQEIN